uniref:Predicted protein n=1 Tax=Hordeum vulgare subsp. vulgare TaxID=112509 RepID=F2DV04_HORVV|nr:predicted protein [Hordeum vulgare subsp. vulgare]
MYIWLGFASVSLFPFLIHHMIRLLLSCVNISALLPCRPQESCWLGLFVRLQTELYISLSCSKKNTFSFYLQCQSYGVILFTSEIYPNR